MDSWPRRPFGLHSSRVPYTSTARVSSSSTSPSLGSSRLSSRDMGLNSERFPRASSTYKTDLDQQVSWTHRNHAKPSRDNKFVAHIPLNTPLAHCYQIRHVTWNVLCASGPIRPPYYTLATSCIDSFLHASWLNLDCSSRLFLFVVLWLVWVYSDNSVYGFFFFFLNRYTNSLTWKVITPRVQLREMSANIISHGFISICLVQYRPHALVV